VSDAVAAEAGGPAGPRREPLFRRLVWLTLFRLVLVTVLLAGTALVTWDQDPEQSSASFPLYALILLAYAGSLGVLLLLRQATRLGWGAAAHVAFDVALAAGLVALTGRAESVFVFLFLLAIIDGAILLGRRGAALGLGLALGAYLLVSRLGGPPAAVPAGTLWAHVAALVATAALSAYLAEQLRSTGERLAARESDLANVTALHEAIVQSVASGLMTVDGADRITFLNRAGEEITGLALGQVRGRAAGEVLPGFAAEGRRGETEWVNARGVRLRLGFSRFPLAGLGGRGLGSAVIFQDLTELRAMEAAMKRSERLADLGRVAAGLAHELRNPLASMAGSVELLSASQGLRQEDQRLMAIVLKEAARLEQLVARFLDYTRPAPPRLAEVDLAQLIGEVAEVFGRDPAAARIKVERSLQPVTLRCDPDQLRQVLWNLLANAAQAIQASGAAGAIRLACAREEAGAIRIQVEDDGPGIAAADQAKLFTPFFTTKAGGTGLGLAIVHRIVESHGGTVVATAVQPRGACFTVRLPVAAAERPAAAHA
jgi:two-component system sensor histidine kinase PilS (NtrC family)